MPVISKGELADLSERITSLLASKHYQEIQLRLRMADTELRSVIYHMEKNGMTQLDWARRSSPSTPVTEDLS